MAKILCCLLCEEHSTMMQHLQVCLLMNKDVVVDVKVDDETTTENHLDAIVVKGGYATERVFQRANFFVFLSREFWVFHRQQSLQELIPSREFPNEGISPLHKCP